MNLGTQTCQLLSNGCAGGSEVLWTSVQRHVNYCPIKIMNANSLLWSEWGERKGLQLDRIFLNI